MGNRPKHVSNDYDAFGHRKTRRIYGITQTV